MARKSLTPSHKLRAKLCLYFSQVVLTFEIDQETFMEKNIPAYSGFQALLYQYALEIP